MAYPWSSHDILTASDLNAAISDGTPLCKVKAATETVTSSTTMQDDNELTMSLGVGTWRVETDLSVGGATGGDIKIAYSTSGTFSHVGTRNYYGPQLATTDTTATSVRASGGNALSTAIPYGVDGTNRSTIRESFVITVTATTTVTLSWAQNATSVTATSVFSGSVLMATKVRTS